MARLIRMYLRETGCGEVDSIEVFDDRSKALL
jgi:hypothetical protein